MVASLKYTRLRLAAFTILAAALFIAVLTWKSLQSLDRKPFLRKYRQTDLALELIAVRDTAWVRFAGMGAHTLYFQNRRLAHITYMDTAFRNKKELGYSLNFDSNQISQLECLIDSPTLYFFEKSIPLTFVGNLTSAALQTHRFPLASFTRVAALSRGSFIFRSFFLSHGKMNQVFVRAQLRTGTQIVEAVEPHSNGDAGLSTDGILSLDPDTKAVAYVYFYKDQWLSLDSFLRRQDTGRTIDGSGMVSTKYLSRVQDGGTMTTNATALHALHGESIAAQGRLFVQSFVAATNEVASLRDYSVIDVYSLADKKYKFSFYVPQIKNEKMESFTIKADRIFVLYPHYLVRYLLPT